MPNEIFQTSLLRCMHSAGSILSYSVDIQDLERGRSNTTFTKKRSRFRLMWLAFGELSAVKVRETDSTPTCIAEVWRVWQGIRIVSAARGKYVASGGTVSWALS